jgi:outer membrane protein assembly factor BamD
MTKFIRTTSIFFLALLIASCGSSQPFKAYQNKTETQIYDQGVKNLDKKKYGSAAKDFEALNAIYPFGAYAEPAQKDLILAYNESDDPGSALAAADRYIRLYPRGANIDYAYYMKGEINFGREQGWQQKFFKIDPAERDLSYMNEAYQSFNQLVTLFPKSKYVPDARKKMQEIRQDLARHQVMTAQFYYERKAYVAAINRAEIVVNNYRDTNQVPAALFIIAKSYEALGQTDNANRAVRTLIMNYPQSAQAIKISKQ